MGKRIKDTLWIAFVCLSWGFLFYALYELSYLFFPEGTLGP